MPSTAPSTTSLVGQRTTGTGERAGPAVRPGTVVARRRARTRRRTPAAAGPSARPGRRPAPRRQTRERAQRRGDQRHEPSSEPRTAEVQARHAVPAPSHAGQPARRRRAEQHGRDREHDERPAHQAPAPRAVRRVPRGARRRTCAATGGSRTRRSRRRSASAATSTSQPAQAATGASPRRRARRRRATLSLDKKPASGGTPASAPSPIVIVTNVTGIARRSPPMPRHQVGADRVDHRAGGEEQQRLERGVGEQVEHRGVAATDRQRAGHVAELADRRPGEHPLDVVLGERGERARRSMVIAAITPSTASVAGEASKSG